jgi:hypothetical protein
MRYLLPAVYFKLGIYIAVMLTIVVLYMFSCLVYSHIKLWITEPGYPERISTMTSQLKMNFSRTTLSNMSSTLKSLMSKRNKGFVGLLNSNLPHFTKHQN